MSKKQLIIADWLDVQDSQPPGIEIDVLTGWQAGNRYQSANGTGPSANLTGYTIWVGVIANTVSNTSQVAIAKSNSVTSTQGESIGSVAGAWGFYVNNVVSPRIGFSNSEVGKLCYMHGVIDNGKIYFYKGGVPLPGYTTIGAYTPSGFGIEIGSFSGGSFYQSGIVCGGICSSTALTEEQIEAHYQALLLDPYAVPPGATNAWRSVDAGASWVDTIGGVSCTRNGTINKVTQYVQNYDRYDYRATVSSSVPLLPQLSNSVGTIKVLPMADSRTAGTGGLNTNAYRQQLLDLIAASGDLNNIDFVGPNTSSASDPNHNGNLGWTSGDHINGKGDGRPTISTVLSTYNPDIVILYVGTNSANNETLMDQERIDYINLIMIMYNFNNNIRLIVCEETESNTPTDNGRLWAHNKWFLTVAWPQLISAGVKLVHVKLNEAINHFNGDYSDGVHENNQGYIKVANQIYPVLRLATGRI